MRGRVTECEQVLSLVRSTKGGQGGLLLVEGDPGMGKSLLLAVAGREAERLGLTLVAVAADELSQAMPLAPLLTALHAGTGLAAFALSTATDPRERTERRTPAPSAVTAPRTRDAFRPD